ncbi:DUF6297 family protein [Nocardioides sp. YIM 152315]|uniref:DUF6297 family protein n=1 Tax=Nocardioides sp. YIM 152315 TaxID=3031760 RepID=UPI0023DADE4A|nr:DUF6297 family protein [Nocardioides sp. YIM 152315]MDF1604623.1 DUF6297 family protein [Nocardioides sp. YIM 152315]
MSAEVRELRRQIREWRRGRATRSLVEAIGDAYVAIFSALVIGAMAGNVLINLRVVTADACTSTDCADARGALGWLLGLLGVAAVLAVARLLGPVLAAPAVGSWLLATPLDRVALLRGRLLGTAAVAAVAGALPAAVGGLLAGFPVAAVAWSAVLAALLCVLLVAAAARAQSTAGATIRVLARALGVLLWAGLAAVAAGLAPGSLDSPAPAGLALAAAVVAVAAAVAVVGALRALPRIPRRRLTDGGALLPGLSGALSGLDLTLLFDILLARHWRVHSSVRVVRGRGAGPTALVWREVVRLRRNATLLALLAGALVLPYVAVPLGIGHVLVVVVTLTGFVFGVGLFAGLRVLSRTPSLLRCFPQPASAVRLACLCVPAGVLVLWGLATAPALHAAVGGAWTDALLVALASGVTVAVAAVRWTSSRPPDYRLPLITSPMGAVPTSLYGSVLRGFDVLLLGTIPLLAAPTEVGAAWSVGLCGAVLTFLVSRR